MRRIYFIRHAMPDIPLGERWCVGRTDLPLGTVGRMQASLLPFVPDLRDKPVFCSYLSRAIDTALPLCPQPIIRNGLEEQDMGVWDGLSFTEIQARFPELYAAREQNPDLWPDLAESMTEVGVRMRGAVQRCLAESEGDIVIVSHKSAIASITGQRARLLHTSVSVVEWNGEVFHSVMIGQVPRPVLDDQVCSAILQAAGTPEHVIAHCRAVAVEALALADRLSASPSSFDRDLLRAAALLHDVARTQPEHAKIGAAWIRALGYPDIADVIALHHDFTGDTLNEAALLYLADKHIQGTRHVSLKERFAGSLDRCDSEEARLAHERRYQKALELETLLYRS